MQTETPVDLDETSTPKKFIGKRPQMPNTKTNRWKHNFYNTL